MSSYGGYDTPDPSQTCVAFDFPLILKAHGNIIPRFEHVAASSATENSVTTGAPTRKRKRGEFDTDPDVGTSLQAEELRKLKARAPAQDNMHDPAFIRQQTGAMINAIKDFTDDESVRYFSSEIDGSSHLAAATPSTNLSPVCLTGKTSPTTVRYLYK